MRLTFVSPPIPMVQQLKRWNQPYYHPMSGGFVEKPLKVDDIL